MFLVVINLSSYNRFRTGFFGINLHGRCLAAVGCGVGLVVVQLNQELLGASKGKRTRVVAFR